MDKPMVAIEMSGNEVDYKKEVKKVDEGKAWDGSLFVKLYKESSPFLRSALCQLLVLTLRNSINKQICTQLDKFAMGMGVSKSDLLRVLMAMEKHDIISSVRLSRGETLITLKKDPQIPVDGLMLKDGDDINGAMTIFPGRLVYIPMDIPSPRRKPLPTYRRRGKAFVSPEAYQGCDTCISKTERRKKKPSPVVAEDVTTSQDDLKE